jgi:trypsin
MVKSTIFFCFLLLNFSVSYEISNEVSNSTLHLKSDYEKIVGGEKIRLSDAPYQASLQLKGDHQCGGSIISATIILTAAHCTYLTRARDLTVRVGTDQVGKGGDVIAVKVVKTHPLFNPFSFNYDFSILQLSQKVRLQKGVKEVIKLPALNNPIDEGTPAFVSGWGDTKNDEESSDFLRGVTVPVINQSECKRVYTSLTNQMVCAGDMDGEIDSCQVKTFELSFYTCLNLILL